MNPMNSTQPSQPSLSIPFPEPFVDLILRYLIAIFDCGDLFQVDESRTKEQVGLTATSHRQLDKRIQHFAEVISELPGDVKRRVLSCSFPHLYKCMQKNPLLLEFVRHIVEQSQSLQYTSVVLSLFRIVVLRLSSTIGEEFLFKPYLQVVAIRRFHRSAS